jgi:preprotein translocase subunit SecG
MESLLITLHYLICFFLIIVILLQAGKGADIGAVFGGASQTMFGSRGPATFLNKATVFVALGFLVTSIYLAHLSKTRTETSIIDKSPITETTTPTREEAPVKTPAASEADKASPAQGQQGKQKTP